MVSPAFERIRLPPVETFTAQRPRCGPARSLAKRKEPAATAISRPSGDQVGLKPKSVKRRTDSPVEPIRKMPPPSRSERKAIRSPSGEKTGCQLSEVES